MNVFQLRNPQALLLPDVQKIIRDATGSVHFIAPGGFDSVAEDIYKFVVHDNYFLFLGAEDGTFKSLVMGFYPADRLFPYPTITLFYNKGSRALIKETAKVLLDTLQQRGYTSAWAVNATGKSDAAWMRLFGLPGKTTAKVLGSVVEIKVS